MAVVAHMSVTMPDPPVPLSHGLGTDSGSGGFLIFDRITSADVPLYIDILFSPRDLHIDAKVLDISMRTAVLARDSTFPSCMLSLSSVSAPGFPSRASANIRGGELSTCRS